MLQAAVGHTGAQHEHIAFFLPPATPLPASQPLPVISCCRCAAQEADPDGFCEPDFHIGLTLLNRK